MKAAYAFVTQTETTKRGIMRITGKSSDLVCVVNNVLPGVFKTMDTTPVVEDEWINVACVGNPVPHKKTGAECLHMSEKTSTTSLAPIFP